jgi:hypothetical protein
MTDTLTQLIAKTQALLLDDATRFTTATCTAAIRQALKLFNTAAPIHAGDLVTPVAGQKEYELDVPTALDVIDVLRQGKDANSEDHVSLDFDKYFEDGRPFFRLRIAEPETNTLIVRYLLPHTISGLDSSTESTLPALFDVILLDGAAWQCCLIRSAGRIETVNMNEEVPDPWIKIGEHFKQSFYLGLAFAAGQTFPRLPDPRTWHDQYQGQY